MHYDMLNDTVIQWIIAVLLVGYSGYNSVKSIQLYYRFKRQWVEFHDRYKKAEISDHSKWFVLGSGFFAVLSLILCFLTGNVIRVEADQLFYYRMAYIVLCIIFIGQAFETYVRRRIWFTEDGLWYVDTYYRYRMITNYEVNAGMFRTVSVYFGNKGEVKLPNNMAVAIQQHEKAWKAAKKKDKKRRK